MKRKKVDIYEVLSSNIPPHIYLFLRSLLPSLRLLAIVIKVVPSIYTTIMCYELLNTITSRGRITLGVSRYIRLDSRSVATFHIMVRGNGHQGDLRPLITINWRLVIARFHGR